MDLFRRTSLYFTRLPVGLVCTCIHTSCTEFSICDGSRLPVSNILGNCRTRLEYFRGASFTRNLIATVSPPLGRQRMLYLLVIIWTDSCTSRIAPVKPVLTVLTISGKKGRIKASQRNGVWSGFQPILLYSRFMFSPGLTKNGLAILSLGLLRKR
jgi:hypothetical protein